MSAHVVVAVLFVTYVRKAVSIGFNPTDDGFILSQAARILDGEVPHVDFVSPRPVGSALLHAVTFAFPFPLIPTSRWISAVEIASTAVFQVLLVRRLMWAVGGAISTAVCSVMALAISLHTFPLMAWHTIDGLLLVSVGTWLVTRGVDRASTALVTLGGFVAGAAVTVKQSFLPVVIVVPMLIWFLTSGADPGCRRRARVAALAVLAPISCYLALDAAMWQGAGLRQMLASSAPSLAPLAAADPAGLVVAVLVGAVTTVAVFRTGSPASRWLRGIRGRLFILGVACFLLVRSTILVLASKVEFGGPWAWALLWASVAAVCLSVVTSGTATLAALVLPSFGIMAALSWGYATPALTAGALYLLVGVATARVFVDTGFSRPATRSIHAPPEITRRLAGSFAGILMVGAILGGSLHVRSRSVYRDVPLERQTADAGSIADALRGVSTGPILLAALSDVVECLDVHPATRLAVVPDGAVVPLLLGRTNPLPADWWYPPEIVLERGLILDRARAATEGGPGHLVLFQEVSFDSIHLAGSSVRPSSSRFFDYEGGYASELFRVIPGQIVDCGTYVGRWMPE